MTLYKGENVEKAIEYLESEAYFNQKRKKVYNDENAQVVRPLFSLVDDDGPFCEIDERCQCHWFPGQPLASTVWDEETEKNWLEEGTEPEIPHQIWTKYYNEHLVKLRTKWTT